MGLPDLEPVGSSVPRDEASPDTTMLLLERVRAGDQAASDALFARYIGPLRRWASGRLPPWARDAADTQDLVQDTLLQTFKRIEQFELRGEGALQAYLRQAVMNRIRDALRRFNRRGSSAPLDSGLLAGAPSPLDEAIGHETAERYERALDRLCAEDREAIVARVELGSSYEELASALGKPSADAARKTASRALARLAAEMKHVR